MSKINLGLAMQALDIGGSVDQYTGVIIHAGRKGNGDNLDYSAGNSTGYVLEVDNPTGTQQMAYNMLAALKLRGAKYQSFSADKSYIDPAAEIGDSVTVKNTDAVIMSIKTNFSHQMAASIAAPFDEEVNHEFAYVPRAEREFRRESAYTRSRLTINEDSIQAEVVRATDSENALRSSIEINATEISAKVSKTGGNASSFGWTLTDSSWRLSSNGSTVLSATSSGLSVSGTITATAGVIGGVTIQNGVLSGIRGGDNGNIAGSTITTANTVSGINTNLGYAAGYGAAIVSGTGDYPSYFTAGSLISRGSITANGNLVLGGNQINMQNRAATWQSKTIGDVTINYLGY